MKYSNLTTILMLIFACLQPTHAYSPYFSLEGKDGPELAKLGITITSKANVDGSIDGYDWVEITYDCSKLAGDREVFMVMQIIDGDGKFVSATRLGRKKGGAKKVTMQIVFDEKTEKHSHLMIGLPEFVTEGAEQEKKTRAFGNPGFGGYTLSVEHLMRLARKAGSKKNVHVVPE